MTHAPTAFRPVENIANSIALLFGADHAERWRAKVLEASVSDDPSWRDLGTAFLVWLAFLDDEAGVFEAVRQTPLTGLRVRGTDGELTGGPDLRESNPNLAFIAASAADAATLALSDVDHANALQCLVVREDCQGASAAEFSYLVAGTSVTAVYGDPLSPTMLQTQRAISGHAIRIIHQALGGEWNATRAGLNDADGELHGVGATGPVICEEAA